MTRHEVESAEAFAVNTCMAPMCSGGDKPDVCCAVLADLVSKRDFAIRAAALEEAAEVLDGIRNNEYARAAKAATAIRALAFARPTAELIAYYRTAAPLLA